MFGQQQQWGLIAMQMGKVWRVRGNSAAILIYICSSAHQRTFITKPNP
jgi:hypothetical protein